MSNREEYSSWNEDQYEYEQRRNNITMITDKEIEECGWRIMKVLVPKECTDTPLSQTQEGSYTEGWQINYIRENALDPWWEMCRKGRHLVIVKKQYREHIGQSWDIVIDVPISNKQELLDEMSYLGIKVI